MPNSIYNPEIPPGDELSRRQADLQAAKFFGRTPFGSTATAAPESGNVREITFQVTDLLGRPNPGRYLILVADHLSEFGTLDHTPTATWTTGLLMDELDDGSGVDGWLVLTDAEGKAVIEVTIVGAGTRYFSHSVVGEVRSSDAVTWT